MDQEKNTPNETQNPVGEVQEPASNPSVTVETPKKKKGLGSRIVHSKDTTKLIASLAFCAVFATCTLLAVTVFDEPGHLGDKGADIRMEQRADSDRGNLPDMGSDNRFNGNRGFDGRGNVPDGNSGAPSEAQPSDKQDSDDNKSPNNESESGNAGSSDSNKKFNDERPGNPSDQQNTPDDSSSKNESSNKSTTTYVA